MRKKVWGLLLSVMLGLYCCSCSNDSSDGVGVVTPFDREEDDINFVINPPTYSFPNFLLKSDNFSKFSRLVYNSFDVDTVNEPFDEPVKTEGGYQCDAEFSDGRFMRFIYGNKYGIIDINGEIKLQGIYNSIRQIRPELFELKTESKTVYAVVDENDNIAVVKDDAYKWLAEKTKPEISQAVPENGDNVAEVTEGTRYILKTPDGKTVFDRSFDSIAESSKENFELDCESVFTAYSGGSYYIIVFDEYYNYSVYEGSYGTVNVAVNDNSGSCYILSYDHLVQLLSLFSSFEYVEGETEPSEDLVTVDLTSSASNQNRYVISSSGSCEITSVAEDGVTLVVNKYKLPYECFADVVKWVDTVLSTEYVKK